MPKIGLPNTNGVSEIEVTRAAIESLVWQIEHLLEGNLDIDNIDKKDNDYALISADTVQDIASTVRPIGGIKVFGKESGTTGETENAFNQLTTKMDANPNLIVLSKLEVREFIRDDSDYKMNAPTDIVIKIEKSPDIRLYPKLERIQSENPYYNVRINAQINGKGTDDRDWGTNFCSVTETAEEITVTIPIDMMGTDWENDSQITMSAEAFVLCERML